MRNTCVPILVAWPVFVWACAPDDAELHARARSEAGAGVESPAGSGEERLIHLEARFGDPAALWGEATYKVKRVNGRRLREMEVEVENAEPGSKHALSLDGFELGSLIVDLGGEAEFEVSEEDDQLFPVGFPEPRAGSVFRVGDLMELRLEPLERLTELEVELAGEGGASAEVGFKVERLGDEVTRAFKVKVKSARPRAVLTVSVDGVHVGDLKVDVEGEAKLAFSSIKGTPFPADFPEPHAGSRVRVGDALDGELIDLLAESKR